MDAVGDRASGAENENPSSSTVLKVNQDETEAYAEAIVLHGFQDTKDLFSADSLAAFSAAETSVSSSSDDEDGAFDEGHNDGVAYNGYPIRTTIRPRIASFEPTTTATDSWNEEDKKNRAVVLTRFSKPKQPPIRRTGVLELARIEHEKRMEILNQEWALKRRILDMKLRAAEMKYEAYRWRAEYFELATKQKFYSNHYHYPKAHGSDHDYGDYNGHH